MRTLGVILGALLVVAGGAGMTLGPFPESALGDPVFYNELGYTLMKEGKTSSAVTAFSTAVDLDPSYERARKNLYVAAFRDGQYLLAAEHARRLLEQNPNRELHFDYAQSLVMWARTQATDGGEALAALEEAAEHLDAAGDWPHATENAAIVRRVMASV